ncbi:MAG: glycosyltransferase family 9 protein [Pseudomonadota bacterium]
MSVGKRWGRVLAVQPWPGLGDAIWHLSAWRAIASHSAHLDLLTKARSRSEDLFAGEGTIRDILILDRQRDGRGRHDRIGGFFRMAREWRARAYDTVMIFHDSPRYAAAAMLASIPQRIGYGVKYQRHFLTRSTLSEAQATAHLTDKIRATLRALELPVSQSPLRVRPDVASAVRHHLHGHRQWAGLCVGSSELVKQMGQDFYSALIPRLASRGIRGVLLAAGPDQAPLVAHLHRAAKAANLESFDTMALAVDEVASLLAVCRWCVGNDTGFLHVAVAMECPSLGLFGPTPFVGYSPLLKGVQLSIDDPMGSLEQVWGAVELLIKESANQTAQESPAVDTS